jgi:phosphatidylglycerophosphate synthase
MESPADALRRSDAFTAFVMLAIGFPPSLLLGWLCHWSEWSVLPGVLLALVCMFVVFVVVRYRAASLE